MIDVDDALLNTDMTVLFSVTRRKETISARGRSQVVPTTTTNVSGTVCAASPSQLERVPEGDRMERHVSITTKFMLRGASKVGADVFKPDVVSYNGVDFIVLDVQPYPEAGSGFVQAIAGSGDIVDEASGS